MTNLFNRNDGTFAQVAQGDLSGNPALTSITKATTANISLGSTSFIDGPSVSQGSSGTWFASGVVTLTSTVGSSNFYAQLWDGTSIIASGADTTAGGSGFFTQIALNGVITSPAGNIKISVADASGAGGTILFNQSGNSKDSFVSAVRIG